MSNPFENTGDDEATFIPFEELIGEGKKYADQEALAKAVYEKDRFIKQLQDENKEASDHIAEREKQLLKLQTVEEIYKQLKDQGGNPPSNPNTQTPPGEQPGQSEVDIEKLFSERFQEYERSKTRQNNLSEAVKVVNEKFGSKASEVINKRSKELGISVEKLQEMAMDNPKVFINLIDTQGTTGYSESPGFVSPNTTTRVPDSGNVRNQKYYEKMKQERPSEYFTPATRKKMMDDALALGEQFYE